MPSSIAATKPNARAVAAIFQLTANAIIFLPVVGQFKAGPVNQAMLLVFVQGQSIFKSDEKRFAVNLKSKFFLPNDARKTCIVAQKRRCLRKNA
jgi:mannose-6-phosphate isomerase class I